MHRLDKAYLLTIKGSMLEGIYIFACNLAGLDHDSDAEDGQVRPRRRRMVSASSFAMDSDDDDQDTRAFDVSTTLVPRSETYPRSPDQAQAQVLSLRSGRCECALVPGVHVTS